ncbi:putative membrane protein YgcG [Catenuloplanes nepalensis]|uniref:Membrane protein YgcG n=1 Tax=Catenuloplanes nepalensis TaxID=587533 RepID=A0ABT9N650_9ACTN|nr:hypothetical protein [Catenuloplanes nepalensis]MDP9799179.1 putative membrane protein YgcG [Catenuloplanes nepalensis]
MAVRTWGRVLLTSLGVSLLVGAGQLGVAYGFGLVRFGRAFADGIENQWNAQLAWVAWFAIIAAVAGALVADRAARRLGHDGGLPLLAGLAVSASIGAAGVALITMPAAHAAQLTDGTEPAGAVGIAVLIGAAAGLPLAALALWQRAYAWALVSVAAVTWLLAVASAVPSFGPGEQLPAVRLGVLDPASFSTGVVQRLAVVVMPSLALIAGAAVGAIARRREWHTAIVATSGLLGPVPLTIAYFAAGPGDAADTYQAAPFWGSVVALAAGALGSLLAVVAHRTDPDPQTPDQTPPPVRGEPAGPSNGPGASSGGARDLTEPPAGGGPGVPGAPGGRGERGGPGDSARGSGAFGPTGPPAGGGPGVPGDRGDSGGWGGSARGSGGFGSGDGGNRGGRASASGGVPPQPG